MSEASDQLGCSLVTVIKLYLFAGARFDTVSTMIRAIFYFGRSLLRVALHNTVIIAMAICSMPRAGRASGGSSSVQARTQWETKIVDFLNSKRTYEDLVTGIEPYIHSGDFAFLREKVRPIAKERVPRITLQRAGSYLQTYPSGHRLLLEVVNEDERKVRFDGRIVDLSDAHSLQAIWMKLEKSSPLADAASLLERLAFPRAFAIFPAIGWGGYLVGSAIIGFVVGTFTNCQNIDNKDSDCQQHLENLRSVIRQSNSRAFKAKANMPNALRSIPRLLLEFPEVADPSPSRITDSPTGNTDSGVVDKKNWESFLKTRVPTNGVTPQCPTDLPSRLASLNQLDTTLGDFLNQFVPFLDNPLHQYTVCLNGRKFYHSAAKCAVDLGEIASSLCLSTTAKRYAEFRARGSLVDPNGKKVSTEDALQPQSKKESGAAR